MTDYTDTERVIHVIYSDCFVAPAAIVRSRGSPSADIRFASAGQVPWSIPNDQSLVGFTTYNQIFWVDSCAPTGLSATEGLRVIVSN